MATMTFSGSYLPEDVEFLLEPTDIPLLTIEEKERRIRAGEHYGGILSAERPPSPAYLAAYEAALNRNGRRFAHDVAVLARGLRDSVGDGATIVSLARAGTPAGVLLTRLLRAANVRDVRHYSVSIIRDRGLDAVAMRTILAARPAGSVRFVDGWTGKGVIRRELRRALAGTPFVDELWVVADLSGTADVAATDDDYLLPSSILGGTVSGLVSRSVWSASGLHRCRWLGELEPWDVSRAFVDRIVAEAPRLDAVGGPVSVSPEPCDRGLALLRERYGATDTLLVKPGIGESTRVLLRRMPGLLLLRDPDDPEVAHLRLLARERGAEVRTEPDLPFRAAALVRSDG